MPKGATLAMPIEQNRLGIGEISLWAGIVLDIIRFFPLLLVIFSVFVSYFCGS